MSVAHGETNRMKSLTALLVSLVIFSAQAELSLPAIFGDNMVLQQNTFVPIWGWAEPKTKISVTFAGQTKSTTADADGKWLVKLDKLTASFEPKQLVVQGGETKTFTNILVGEVWLGSGQSNMEKPIGNQPGQKPTFNAEAELAAAEYPNIRIFKIEKTLAATAQTKLPANSGWRMCSSNSLNTVSFSAAEYFFGREIHTNLNVPVGLIESSWGGTAIEPWTPPNGFKKISALAPLARTQTSTNKLANTRPMAIFNAMISPIAGYGMRGALWYQGEQNCIMSNDVGYVHYPDKMAALVGGWRELWDQGPFPFYFVQIAPFKYFSGKMQRVKSIESLPQFWEQQSRAARKLKNSGMIVTTDLVDSLNDIHPRDKATVGHRLALLALSKTYGKNIACEGPVFRRARFTNGKAILKFDHAEGLKSRDGQPLTWFTIAGADGKFVSADAAIVGDTVEVSAKDISAPKAVRFAWSELAQPNLVNAAGLPAEPFRTDRY